MPPERQYGVAASAPVIAGRIYPNLPKDRAIRRTPAR